MYTSIKKIVAIGVTIATAILPFANATPAFAATPNWDTTGSYVINVVLGADVFPENLVLAQTGAAITGTSLALLDNSSPWTIDTGSVSGDTVYFEGYFNANPGMRASFSGTVAPDGSMSGTWMDLPGSMNRSGTWATTQGVAKSLQEKTCSTITLVSGTGTQTAGYTETTQVGPATALLPTSYSGTAFGASTITQAVVPPWVDPATDVNFSGSGAAWISTHATWPGGAGNAEGNPSFDQWRIFHDGFTLPINATVTSAVLKYTADNAADVYENGNTSAISTTNDTYGTPGALPMNFANVYSVNLTPVAGANTLDFVVRNWGGDYASNPTGLLYKATIDYCVPVVVTPPFVASCPAETTKAASPIETVVVSSAQSSDTLSTNVLTNGMSYILRATGVADAGDNIAFDAKYSFRTPTSVSWTDSVSTYESYGPTLLDLTYNGTTPWGNFEATHAYEALVTGNGAQAHFLINDAYYPNNIGSLSVDITPCIPNVPPTGSLTVNKVTIGGDGTFSFTGAGENGFNITTVSGAGNKTVDGLTPGSYSVVEAAQTGWSQTSNTCTNVSVVAGQTASCTITNTALGTISGMKYNDLNRNGKKDANEPGLSGWVIRLIMDNPTTHKDTLITTATTDANGNYTFTNILPGTYDVRETHQKGWKRQSKNPKDIVISAGTVVAGVDFGNAVTKKGEKEDTDNDDNHRDQDGKYFAHQGRSNYGQESDSKNHDH